MLTRSVLYYAYTLRSPKSFGTNTNKSGRAAKLKAYLDKMTRGNSREKGKKNKNQHTANEPWTERNRHIY